MRVITSVAGRGFVFAVLGAIGLTASPGLAKPQAKPGSTFEDLLAKAQNDSRRYEFVIQLARSAVRQCFAGPGSQDGTGCKTTVAKSIAELSKVQGLVLSTTVMGMGPQQPPVVLGELDSTTRHRRVEIRGPLRIEKICKEEVCGFPHVICPHPDDTDLLSGQIESWDADVAEKESIAFLPAAKDSDVAWAGEITVPERADAHEEAYTWAQIVFTVSGFEVVRHKDPVVARQMKSTLAQLNEELRHINQTVDDKEIPHAREVGLRRMACLKTYSPGVNQGVFRVKILGVRLWMSPHEPTPESKEPITYLLSTPPSLQGVSLGGPARADAPPADSPERSPEEAVQQ